MKGKGGGVWGGSLNGSQSGTRVDKKKRKTWGEGQKGKNDRTVSGGGKNKANLKKTKIYGEKTPAILRYWSKEGGGKKEGGAGGGRLVHTEVPWLR